MSGPPGAGKTLLARCVPTILPKLPPEEMLEVTKIYSVAGMLPSSAPQQSLPRYKHSTEIIHEDRPLFLVELCLPTWNIL